VKTAAKRSAPRHAGVLQVVLSLTPGGTERLVIQLVRSLAPTFRMTVCCLDEPGAWAGELQQAGIDIVALGRRPGFHPRLGRDIAAVAERVGARVLHCHHYSPFVYGCIARACDPHLRIVFTEHGRVGDSAPSRKRRMANALFSRFPHRVCVVSADLQRHMAAEGFAADGVEVVPNGIDPGTLPDDRARREARQLLGVGDEAFVIGTVGRLDPVKDLPTLVEAFASVRQARPGARLVIVGDGPARAELERLAGAAPDIRLLGHRSDVRRLLPGFDVYASSSVFEGVSLTILEAMATGCPVVATRVGGTPEVVVDGDTGLLVESRSPSALAGALARVAAAPGLAAALGQAGRTRVCERFSLDRMINHYATAYSELGAS
jgi:glycosyltransferase involved in cell wall biosynthesis